MREKLRRILLIHPRFQLSVLGFGFTLSMGMWTVLLIAVHQAITQIQLAALSGSIPAQHPLFEAITEQRHAVSVVFLMTALFGTITLLSVGLAITLRAAGPIYRLQKHLEEVIHDQTLDDVRFRKDDYFHELSDVFNLHMARYRSLHQRLHESNDTLRSKKSA